MLAFELGHEDSLTKKLVAGGRGRIFLDNLDCHEKRRHGLVKFVKCGLAYATPVARAKFLKESMTK